MFSAFGLCGWGGCRVCFSLPCIWRVWLVRGDNILHLCWGLCFAFVCCFGGSYWSWEFFVEREVDVNHLVENWFVEEVLCGGDL